MNFSPNDAAYAPTRSAVSRSGSSETSTTLTLSRSPRDSSASAARTLPRVAGQTSGQLAKPKYRTTTSPRKSDSEVEPFTDSSVNSPPKPGYPVVFDGPCRHMLTDNPATTAATRTRANANFFSNGRPREGESECRQEGPGL